MIPFKDDNPTRRFPFLTIALIVANTLIFLFQIFSPEDSRNIVYSYGAIPSFLLSFREVQPIHPFATVFTSMFMHGNLLHLGTNMLFLWIFGNNIEDKLGYVRFIIFYLMCGITAFTSFFNDNLERVFLNELTSLWVYFSVILTLGGGAGNRTRVRKHYFQTSTCLSYLLVSRNQTRR